MLEYLAPRDGRPAPSDLHANDIAHWQTTMVVDKVDGMMGLARDHRIDLVSPGPVDVTSLMLGFRSGALTRDPDGHGLRFIQR